MIIFSFERFKPEAAEEVLVKSQQQVIALSVIGDRVENAIGEHKLWQDKVDQFFSLTSAEQSWSGILELEDSRKDIAFICLAMDLVLFNVRRLRHGKN